MAKTINIIPPVIGDYRERPAQQGRIQGGTRVISDFHTASVPGHVLVSIITVVLNGEKNIEKTIQSVLDQTYDNIEYFIIDGGSTDGTLDMIRKHEDKIAYWISESDNGISDAFNKGIAGATGEIIGIINADDWYEPNAVESAVSRLMQEDTDIVHGMVQYRDTNGQKTELFYGNDALLHKDMTINHPSVFARKRAYEKIGLFRTDFRYAMDYEWLLRAKVNGLRFSYIESCLSHVRLAGASDRNWKYARMEVAKAKDMHCPGISNRIFYAFQIVKGSCRRFLEMTGLGCIVEFYHKRISYLKKVKSS
jgi:glycosyltransferase involved in cell wall biosynthesis